MKSKHKLVVRKGQLWKRKKDGIVIVINRGAGDSWYCYQINNTRISHHIKRFSLVKYWTLLEKPKINMKEIIETLYPMNRCLLGEGYDSALEYIKHLIDLEILEIDSGKKLGTWTVPDEWIVRDAWIKDPSGNKIVDYKKDPLSLVVYSTPIHGTCSLDELRYHLNYIEDKPDKTPYIFKFYEKDWGFCLPKNMVREALPNPEIDQDETMKTGETVWKSKFKDVLPQGDYEVFVDTEFKPGKMKIGVHTIPGKSDREILIFAHLDHPYQANDNLSGVACLLDLVKKIKCEHTVKIIFCPETIGSIAYAYMKSLSKVDFVIAVDVCGNDNTLLLQKPWDAEHRFYRVSHLAIQGIGETYRQAPFRSVIGSDEYIFNDPIIGIPGILLSRFPYDEYHTSEDTPEKINYPMIEKTGQAILKIIDIWERDFIPLRNHPGPIMRSRYNFETPSKQINLAYDYFFYSMDGKRSLAELCCEYGLNFDHTYDIVMKMIDDKAISRINISQEFKPETLGEKQKTISRETDVGGEHGEVSPYSF